MSRDQIVKNKDLTPDYYKPIAEQLGAGRVFKTIWKAPGPWQFR
jgi:hypothetical protein